MNCLRRLALQRVSSVVRPTCHYSSTTTTTTEQRPTPLVRVDDSNDGLRTITLNDTKTRNALSLEMMTQLTSAVESCGAHVRTIAIRGGGGGDNPVFSSGHNLRELSSERGEAFHKHIFATCTSLMMAIRSSPVPVVGGVDGVAAAAGCQLVAACDFAVCTARSTFSTPGARLGLFCSTPGVTISRRVPRSTAAYMLLTGAPLSSTEALNAGLVVKVVDDAEALDHSIAEIHSMILGKSRAVIALGKKFFHEQVELPSYHTALVSAENVMVRNLQLTDGQEGIRSFAEKRKPKWTHE